MNKEDLYIGQILIQTAYIAHTIEKVIDIQSELFTIEIIKYVTHPGHYADKKYDMSFGSLPIYRELTPLEKIKYL